MTRASGAIFVITALQIATASFAVPKSVMNTSAGRVPACCPVGAEPVAVDLYTLQKLGYRVILDNLLEEHGVLRHNPDALSQLLFEEFLSSRTASKTRR